MKEFEKALSVFHSDFYRNWCREHVSCPDQSIRVGYYGMANSLDLSNEPLNVTDHLRCRCAMLVEPCSLCYSADVLIKWYREHLRHSLLCPVCSPTRKFTCCVGIFKPDPYKPMSFPQRYIFSSITDWAVGCHIVTRCAIAWGGITFLPRSVSFIHTNHN